jgi:hypothetical protein
MNAQL